MKRHNFSAGPSILPDEVIKNMTQAIEDFNGSGLSLLSISHRTKPFEDILAQTDSLMRELLDIPANYKILLLAGGATTRFYEIPANFLTTKAAYVNTGVWADKAINEAKFYGEVDVVASGEDKKFSYIPKGFHIPQDADYLHITTNNTIYGTQSKEDLTSPIPLIADMSSDIASRPIDVSKYAMIYGGAQKNLGAAGVAFLIIRDDMVEKGSSNLPSMLQYRNHVANSSMFNTPPVISIFSVYETLKWLKGIGGVKEAERRNAIKSEMLYDTLDRSTLFCGSAADEDRSVMNISFNLVEGREELYQPFLDMADECGMYGVKGHRLAGGYRVSSYNALPEQSMRALVEMMQKFEKQYK